MKCSPVTLFTHIKCVHCIYGNVHFVLSVKGVERSCTNDSRAKIGHKIRPGIVRLYERDQDEMMRIRIRMIRRRMNRRLIKKNKVRRDFLFRFRFNFMETTIFQYFLGTFPLHIYFGHNSCDRNNYGLIDMRTYNYLAIIKMDLLLWTSYLWANI